LPPLTSPALNTWVGEELQLKDYRGDRVNDGVSPRTVESQLQLATRILF